MNFNFLFFLFFLFSCKGVNTQVDNEKPIIENIESKDCYCINIDTTYLSGNIMLNRCRDDSFAYLHINTLDTCFKYFQTSYDFNRLYYVFSKFYDFDNYFVIESYCGSSLSMCFSLVSKTNFALIDSGEFYTIDTVAKILVYFSNDGESLIAYSPDTEKKTKYSINNKIDINKESYYMKRKIVKINKSILTIKVEDLNETHTFYAK